MVNSWAVICPQRPWHVERPNSMWTVDAALDGAVGPIAKKWGECGASGAEKAAAAR